MALKENALYEMGIKRILLFALNDDLSKPSPSGGVIGGAGTFNFSGVDDNTEVPITIVVDTTKYATTIDISTASVQTAVTPTEFVAALSAAITAGSIPVTASVDSTTGRVKVIATGTPQYLQVYGEAARLAMFGQGFGVKYLVSGTMVSTGGAPRVKDMETISVTDANGFDTEMVADEKVKGSTETLVDSAKDPEIAALMNGTVSEDGSLSSGNQSTKRPYFGMIYYYAKYRHGQNEEAAVFGYQQTEFFRCKGTIGNKDHAREFAAGNYTVTTYTHVDANGVEQDAWKDDPLTKAAYAALDIDGLGSIA